MRVATPLPHMSRAESVSGTAVRSLSYSWGELFWPSLMGVECCKHSLKMSSLLCVGCNTEEWQCLQLVVLQGLCPPLGLGPTGRRPGGSAPPPLGSPRACWRSAQPSRDRLAAHFFPLIGPAVEAGSLDPVSLDYLHRCSKHGGHFGNQQCALQSLRAPGKRAGSTWVAHFGACRDFHRSSSDGLVSEGSPHWSLFLSQVGAKHLTHWRPLRTTTAGRVPRSQLIPQMRRKKAEWAPGSW